MSARHILFRVVCLIVAATMPCAAFAASQTVTHELGDIPHATITYARPADQFTDADIAIPKGFALRGIEKCTGQHPEPPACPLRKPLVRIKVQRVETQAGGSAKADERWDAVNDAQLSSWLADHVNGIGRFRVLSNDVKNPLRADAVLRVNAIKTAQYTYKGTYGEAVYGLTLSSAFLDPGTGEMLPNPKVPQLPVRSDPKRYYIVNNRIVAGLNFADERNVEALFQNLAARSFRGAVNALLNELPSTAQVIALRESRATLDRGIEFGILDRETMIMFQDKHSVLEPVAVMEVVPGHGSSHGTIHRWKDSPAAAEIRRRARGAGFNSLQDRIFAVSVGVPANYAY